MPKLAVGTKVNISPKSEYYPRQGTTEGKLIEGTIMKYESGRFNYSVDWSNGKCEYFYNDIDLVEVNQGEPSYEVY